MGFDRELTSEYEIISNQETSNLDNNKKSTITYSQVNIQPQLIQILEDSNNSTPEIINQTDTFQNLHSQSNSPTIKRQNLMNSGKAYSNSYARRIIFFLLNISYTAE